MNLKTILRNFLNHFENLEAHRKYPNGEQDLYSREFQSLKELTESIKHDSFYSCHHGLKDVNRRKNRYKDILPYDYSRVILSEYPGVPGSDYINANFVRGSTGSSCAYVASQGPLPNTVVDFWRMIWECEVSVIVMACNETESGKYKCELYWPAVTDQEQQYGNITVQLIKWRQVCPDFLVRTFRVRCDNEERIVCQFHYTTWPDHGVPSSVGPILELVRLMRDAQFTEARPILVHCSAGCGRTGTICSIDYVWALLRTGKLKQDFSLYKIIHEMRRQRIAMVQTQEQYILCYRAVAALFEQQLKMIDAHTYENLDEDGEPYHHRFIPDKNSSEEACSSDESVSPGYIETRNSHSNKVKRSATFPSKDMRQLIESWRDKNLTENLSGFHTTHLSDSTNLGDVNGSHDNKQEKLIGRATVIRRPSVVRYKALFGSMELSQLSNQQNRSHSPTSNNETERYHLHRSFAHFPTQSDCTESLAASDQDGDLDKENPYQPIRSRNGTKLGELRPLANNFFRSAIDIQSHSVVDSNESRQDQSSECDELDYGVKFPISSNRNRNNEGSAITQASQPTSSYFGEDVPPPKPPRTYQYRTKVNHVPPFNGESNSWIVNQPNGIIVSVAQRVRPRVRVSEDDKASLRSESKSQNDLYATSTYATLPSLSFNPLTANNFFTNSSSNNNKYQASFDKQMGSNSSQGGGSRFDAMLYETLKNNAGQSMNYPSKPREGNFSFHPNLSNLKPPTRMPVRGAPTHRPISTAEYNDRIGNLRRELTSPAILMSNNHRHSQKHHFHPSQVSDHPMVPPARSRPLTSMPTRPRPRMDQAERIIQQQKPSCSASPAPRKPPHHPISNPMHHHHQQAVTMINRSNSTVASHSVKKPLTVSPIESKSSNEPIFNSPEKKKVLKSNSKSLSKEAKPNGQHSIEKKHYTFSFTSSFFPFRKSSKSKAPPGPNQQQAPHPTSGPTNIRPPHSHRFSPPTQWSQV